MKTEFKKEKRRVAPCLQPLRFALQCISDKKYLITFLFFFLHSKGAKACNDLKMRLTHVK